MKIEFLESAKRDFAKLGLGFRDQFPWWTLLWWEIEYYLSRPKYWFREVVYFIQRGKYGYSNRDTWDMHSYLGLILPSMLKDLREMMHGHPADLTPKQWEKILQKMETGFRAGKELSDEYPDKRRAVKLQREFDEAMDLLKKWYFHLWD